MDKKDLKNLLKPLMKECVRELLMEEGMLKVINEVVQPRQQNLGQREPQQIENMKKTFPTEMLTQDPEQVKRKIEENRKKMLDEIGRRGYLNGVNPFEGTEPLTESQAPERQSGVVTRSSKIPPAMNSIDPSDPGVNITGIINLAAGKWNKHLGGKG